MVNSYIFAEAKNNSYVIMMPYHLNSVFIQKKKKNSHMYVHDD